MKHELKCVDPFFGQVYDGEKTLEMRFNDRNFQKGDIIDLKRYNSSSYNSPYEPIVLLVTNVLTGERWGIKDGWCAISFQVQSKPEWKDREK